MVSEQDSQEKKLISEFECECHHGNERGSCSSLFSPMSMMEMRQQFREIDYYKDHTNQLDLVIIGLLRALVCRDGVTRSSKKKTQKERTESRTVFMLGGHVVCEKTFLFAHNLLKKRYKRLKKLYLNFGLAEPQHGNTNAMPHNAILPEMEARVVSFIRECSAARPVPSGLPAQSFQTQCEVASNKYFEEKGPQIVCGSMQTAS